MAHWYERVHPDDVEAVAAQLAAAVAGEVVYDPVFRVLAPDGRVRIIQAGAQIERDAEGKALRVTGINRDITSQRELEAHLLQARDRADSASAAKSFFLANMSHEIRTPMNAVLGMLQLVQHTDLNARQHDYVVKAQTAAKSLLGLLNDILDYSKIEAGKLRLDLHPFELEPLMRDLAVVLAGNQGSKEVEVMFDLDSQLPGSLVGQRLEVYPAGAGGGQYPPVAASGGFGKAADRGVRHRHRNQCRAVATDLRGLHPGGSLDHSPLWWHRAGAGDLQAAGGADGWRVAGGQ